MQHKNKYTACKVYTTSVYILYTHLHCISLKLEILILTLLNEDFFIVIIYIFMEVMKGNF